MVRFLLIVIVVFLTLAGISIEEHIIFKKRHKRLKEILKKDMLDKEARKND